MSQIITKFDWNNFYVQEKLDGSLIIFYWYNDKWNVNTRNSFGYGNINDYEFTWESLVLSCLDSKIDLLNKEYTHIFELTSCFNKVVKLHKEPKVWLLSIFNKQEEISFNEYMNYGSNIGLNLPKVFYINSQTDIKSLLNDLENQDKTNEGIVLRDKNNNRIKCKTSSYLALHRLSNNGNVASTKNLVPLALAGETDEVVAYFPYLQERLDKISDIIQKLQSELDNIFFCHWDVKSRKKYAEEVKKHPLSCILFSVYGQPYGEVNMREELKKNENKVIEYIDNKL